MAARPRNELHPRPFGRWRTAAPEAVARARPGGLAWRQLPSSKHPGNAESLTGRWRVGADRAVSCNRGARAVPGAVAGLSSRGDEAFPNGESVAGRARAVRAVTHRPACTYARFAARTIQDRHYDRGVAVDAVERAVGCTGPRGGGGRAGRTRLRPGIIAAGGTPTLGPDATYRGSASAPYRNCPCSCRVRAPVRRD